MSIKLTTELCKTAAHTGMGGEELGLRSVQCTVSPLRNLL